MFKTNKVSVLTQPSLRSSDGRDTIFSVIDPFIGVVIAAILGPIGAYVVAARKMSGKIATTEAAQLWEESRAIREWSAKRMEACDAECSNLRNALTEALGRIKTLEDQLENAHEHILDLERGINE